MKKRNSIKYGITDIPAGSAICVLEKGGDKDNKARYRFADTGKRTKSRIVELISNELTLPDLYGATWAHTKEGWVKAEEHITWYESYEEANKTLDNITGRKKKTLITLIVIAAIALVIYMLYKRTKSNNIINQITNPISEPDIPDEIPMD